MVTGSRRVSPNSTDDRGGADRANSAYLKGNPRSGITPLQSGVIVRNRYKTATQGRTGSVGTLTCAVMHQKHVWPVYFNKIKEDADDNTHRGRASFVDITQLYLYTEQLLLLNMFNKALRGFYTKSVNNQT